MRAGYLWEAKQRNLPVVFAADEVDTIANTIWKLVTETLAVREPSKAALLAQPSSIKEIIEHKAIAPSPRTSR